MLLIPLTGRVLKQEVWLNPALIISLEPLEEGTRIYITGMPQCCGYEVGETVQEILAMIPQEGA